MGLPWIDQELFYATSSDQQFYLLFIFQNNSKQAKDRGERGASVHDIRSYMIFSGGFFTAKKEFQLSNRSMDNIIVIMCDRELYQ